MKLDVCPFCGHPVIVTLVTGRITHGQDDICIGETWGYLVDAKVATQ
jgi:hypothetical protein